MPHIPVELVTGILSRLPVKPLMRFRCVCKLWLALMNSPHFINLHLSHSNLSNSHRHLALTAPSLFSLDLDSLHNLIQLNHPLKPHQLTTEIVGSSNGLVCLYNSPQRDIVFWNPSTQTHHKLPPIDFTHPNGFLAFICNVHGFGYDHVHDDYKVVWIRKYYSCDGCSFPSRVYSLKSNSWQRIAGFPYSFRYIGDYGVFANGALHWVVTPSDKCVWIAAFDLGAEEYRLVPQPHCLDTDSHMNVGVLGGCLRAISGIYSNYVDVWVMKDYGLKESWTKFISVEQTNDFISSCLLPIAFLKRNEQVLLQIDNEQFLWYDLKSKKVVKREKLETITNGVLRFFLNSNVYVESLVKLPAVGGRMNLPSVENRTNAPRQDGFQG